MKRFNKILIQSAIIVPVMFIASCLPKVEGDEILMTLLSEVQTTLDNTQVIPAGLSPDQVMNLSATPVGDSQINLLWDAATDPDTPSVYLAYEICTSTVTGGCDTFLVSETTLPGATTYGKSGLNPFTAYYFRVRAIDSTGNRGVASNEATATTLPAGTANSPDFKINDIITNGGIFNTDQTVAISTSLSGSIICYTTNGVTPACDVTPVCTTGTQYSVPILISATAGTTSTTTLKAVTCKYSYNTSSPTSAIFTIDKQIPMPVTGLTVTTSTTTNTLNWTNPGGDFAKVEVYQGLLSIPNEPGALLYSGTNNSYAETVPVCATVSYTIFTFDTAGNYSIPVYKPVNTHCWTHQAYLKAPNAEAGDWFGQSVSVSGDTIVVGAIYEDSNQTAITNGTTASADNSATEAGAAYVFVRSGTTWSHQAYLKAPNARAGDWFGQSVSVSGDTIVVGAYAEDSGQTTITNSATVTEDNTAGSAGSAYVFVRSGTVWSHQAYLKAPNADSNDFFGYAVSVSGDTVVVGAYQEQSNQTTITNGTTASADNTFNQASGSAGAAYVFVRSGTVWSQQAYLKAPNAGGGDCFGYSVSVSGDSIVAGAYWEDSNQVFITNGTTASTDNSASNSGAAYVFVRSGTVWSHQAYLKAPNAQTGDIFGNSVSLSADTIVVGAYWEDSNQTTITNGATASTSNTASASGAAYVFVRSGTTWINQAYLKAPNAEANDEFGNSVSVSGDTIVVGAHFEDSNQTTISNTAALPQPATDNDTMSGAGAAYVFVRSGTTWAYQAYLKAPNADYTAQFGEYVSISSNTIVVGSNNESNNQTTITNGSTVTSGGYLSNVGAAYVFVF